MRPDMVPDVFEIPEAMEARPRGWLAALAMTAVIIGGTLALVVANEIPREEPQVTVIR